MEFTEKFKEMMETQGDDDHESEKIPEALICCVCLDLLYKPVVLVCGHISCFWCVHKSMSGLQSRCPICRNHYYHFPAICQIFHLLLLKMYPSAYKRRENQTLEYEKEMGFFSPELTGSAYQLQPEESIIQPSDALLPCSSEADSSLNPCIVGANLLDRKEYVGETNDITIENGKANQIPSSDTYQQVSVSVDDVLCGYCKRVLFRPIVLNCGHAFCRCCIAVQTNEMLKCGVCQSPHPGDIPKVCLEFDHLLEEQYPEEYVLRKDAFQMKQEKFSKETARTCSSEVDEEIFHFSLPSVEDPVSLLGASSNVHFGVGCDSCGRFPIIGDRYKCKDCVEKVGYDLCKDCYTTRSKLPGRFNQQHTLEHQFEIIKSNEMQKIIRRILRGQLQEASAVSTENAISSLPDNTNEDVENVVDSLLPSSDTEANWRENQRSA